MKKTRALYFSGILLAVVLVAFIYSQILDTDTAATSRVEHSLVKTDQKSIISFKIYNDGDQDLNYTYAIFLNNEELTSENPVLVRVNSTYRYGITIPSEKIGDGRVNVLIYRGAGDGKTLIDNKIYYLK